MKHIELFIELADMSYFTLVYYIIPYVLIHSFDAFSENLHCNSNENKEKTMRRCVQTSDW